MADLDGENYDSVILGTGLTECILSGVLSTHNRKKVLHTDKNLFYGGDTASLKIEQLFEKYPVADEGRLAERKAFLGQISPGRWGIDVTPKLIMLRSFLTNILNSIPAIEGTEFGLLGGSFVMDPNHKSAADRIPEKIPASPAQARSSNLVGMFEKFRLKNFVAWVLDFDEKNPATYSGYCPNISTMDDIYKEYSLASSTKDFIGHAMALHPSDAYLHDRTKTLDTIHRIKMYAVSVAEECSPYIYPLYGLSTLSEFFARQSSIHGGTFMLSTKVRELHVENGAVTGISMRFESEDGDSDFTVRTNTVVADPSYFPEFVEETGEYLAKAILILEDSKLNSKVPKCSMQTILPKPRTGINNNQVMNDIYIVRLKSELEVCQEGYSIAIVSTLCPPNVVSEVALSRGIELFAGAIKFMFSEPPIALKRPISDDRLPKGLYLSRSYDASTHFESTTDNVKELYHKIEGKDLEEIYKSYSEQQSYLRFHIFK